MTNIQNTSVIIQPSRFQWIVDKYPLIALNIAGYACIYTLCMPKILISLMVFMSLYLGYQFLFIRKMIFTITEEMIIYQRGVLNQKRDYIELYRVVDFSESVSFFQNILGLKNVTIMSGDRSTPTLTMPGILNNNDVVPIIRQRVEINKKRKGIYEITNR